MAGAGGVELTYKQLETTLAAHLQINPDRIPTFRSRIKQLQRLEFPSGVNVGRGAKMVYTGEHLFKLVTAFELLGVGLPAQSVTELTERHWTEFSGAYALARLNRLSGKFKRKIYAQLILRSMHEIQFGKYDDPVASKVLVQDHEFLAWNLEAETTRGVFCHPYLLVSEILERVTKMAEEIAGVRAVTADCEVLKWLPNGEAKSLMFKGPYPDRSNLPVRQNLQAKFGNDPDSLTPDGVEEADAFYKWFLRDEPPDF
jgi:hypothetical protein